MTEDDFRDLIDQVSRLMDDARCGDLADEALYTYSDGGETFLLSPKKRLLEMLEAFDRRLTLFDRRLLEKANSRIANVVGPTWTGRVVVETARDGSETAIPFVDLSEIPDLGQTRKTLRSLIDALQDDSGEPEPWVQA